MAIDFPSSKIIGFDISPVYGKMVCPANVIFRLADLTQPLPFPDDHFDLVFMRCLVAGLENKHWPLTLKELMRVTKPGGWIELVEVSFYVKRVHFYGRLVFCFWEGGVVFLGYIY